MSENLKFDASVDISKFEANIRTMEAQIRHLENTTKGAGGDAAKSIDNIGESAKKTGGILSGVGGLMAGAFASIGIAELGRNIIEVASSFQKYEAVLTNSLGSQQEAQEVMAGIQDFASKTPFQLDELTGAYVKLTNYGLRPTMEQMRQYGDLASSVGKGFDQLAEAAADAVTGEFERLKEFGIKAAKEGDKITFTFKGQATEVKNSATEIQNYLVGLGDMKGVKGSMEAISKTMGGQISNLQDKISEMFNEIGQGSSGAISGAIGMAGKLVEHYQEIAKVVGVMVIAYGSYKAVLMVTQAMQKANIAAEQIKNFFNLTKAIQGATVAQHGLNAAQKANVIGLAIAGITTLIAVVMMFREKVKTAAEAQQEFNELQQQTKDLDVTTGMIDRYDELTKKQSLTNEEQAEYNGLIESLSKKYPDAIAKIDEHGRILGLNSEKLKTYNDQQKEALKLVATEQLSEAEKAIKKVEAKLKLAQSQTGETKQKYISYGPGGGGEFVDVERSGKERAKAAEQVLKLSEELVKLKEVQSGLQETLGVKPKVEVGVEVVSADEDAKDIKATVSEQIKQINDEIKAQEKELKAMRLPGATATPEDIEATEKGIKELKGRLATLTGEKVKAAGDKSKESVKGSIAYIEDELKNLKEKAGTFTDPAKEAENSKKITEKIREIGEAWGEVRTERDKTLDITKTDSTGKNAKMKVADITPFQTKEIKLQLAPVKELTEEEKKKLAVIKQQVDAQNEITDKQEAQKELLEDMSGALGDAGHIMGGVSNLAGSFSDELGEASGFMTSILDQSANLVSSLAKGDYVAAISSALSLIGSIIKESNELESERIDAAIEYNAMLRERIELLRSIGELTYDEATSETIKKLAEAESLAWEQLLKRPGISISKLFNSKDVSFEEMLNDVYGFGNWSQKTIMDITSTEEAWKAFVESFKSVNKGWTFDAEANVADIATLTTEWIKARQAILYFEEENKEYVLGFNSSSLTDSIVDGITNGLKLAKDGLGDFADSFKGLLQKAAVQAMTSTFEAKYLNDLMDQFYTAMESEDGGVRLTEDERKALQDSYRLAVEGMQDYYKEWSSLFDEANEDASKATGISGEAKQITERTATAIEGNMNAMLFNIIDTKKTIDQQLVTLQEIRNNTSHNYRLVMIDDNIDLLRKGQLATNDILNKIAIKETSNYGL